MSARAECFHCKEKVEVVEAEKVRTKNERLRLAGKCAKCGKSVSQFIRDPERPQLSPEEKKTREEKRREERKKLSPQKEIKKNGKKRALKPCKLCLCKQHDELIEEQPKKKTHRVSLKEKREKEIQELKELINALKSEKDALKAEDAQDELEAQLIEEEIQRSD